MAKHRIRAIDICGGAGGWACAARGLPIDIVLSVDLWDLCCKTYELNHAGVEVVCADLRDEKLLRMIVRRFKHVDLVLGGIPCEQLSNYRNIWKTTPYQLEQFRLLVDAVLGLVKKLKPRWWCLEDVRGLIPELPPFTPYQEFNAGEYSGQKRSRIFVGEFPPPPRGKDTRVLADYIRPGPYRVGKRLFPREPATHGMFDGKHYRPWYVDKKSGTVFNASSRHDAEMGIVDPSIPGGKRQLEWQEAARLQGFPEDYVFYGSPTAVGKMVGQAIQIDLGRAILEAIVKEGAKGS